MTPARELTAAVAGCTVGAALALVAANESWAEGDISRGAGFPVEHVELTSSDVAPSAAGLALLALAAVAALVATQGVTRRLVGLLVLASGAGITLTALYARTHAQAAAAAQTVGAATVEITLQPWSWLAAAGGLLVGAAGCLIAVRGAQWPSMSRRYEAPGAPPPAVDARQAPPEDVWRALDRGDDPTAR